MKQPTPRHELLLDAAAIAVLLVWIASSVRAYWLGDYAGLQLTTPVALIVAAGLFAPTIIRRNGERGDE